MMEHDIIYEETNTKQIILMKILKKWKNTGKI